MTITKPVLACLASAALLAACSDAAPSEASETSADPVTAEDAATAPAGAEASTKPAAADWSGINDAEVRAAIDSELSSFSQEAGQKWDLLVVEKHEGTDFWQAAGIAAFDLGGPAIVVSTGQKDIQFVGDEGLAYAVDERAQLAKETAEYFDRGEFVEGTEHAISGIKAIWNGE